MVEVVKVCKTLHWYCEPCDNTANAQNHSDQLLTTIKGSITLCLEKVSDNLRNNLGKAAVEPG